MTNKEISQRLKEVGFREITGGCYDKDGNPYTYHFDVTEQLPDLVPAYDAETLFKWLRENAWDVGGYEYEIHHDAIIVLHNILDLWPSPFKFKSSLADMLGEAIIWIKEQG